MLLYTIAESQSSVIETNGLSQITEGCVCPGDVLTYQCSVSGGIATVWRGSAFDCINNSITLHHEQYGFGNAIGECSDSHLLGQGLYLDNRQYVSILNVTVNSNFNNTTIECFYSDDFRLIPIGRKTINTNTLIGG